jgi:two-component system, OmpR family, response regulator VicR
MITLSRILLVEDEKILAKNLSFFLEKEGFVVDSAHDGLEGLELFQRNQYELLLLDWTLPGMDGLELCRTIRKQSSLPIIMITAKEELVDRVVGLEVGADDYLTKPFHQRELLARIRALLRRSGMSQEVQDDKSKLVSWRGLGLDKDRMVMVYNDKSTPLTGTEYKLLDLFMKRPEQVFTRELLFEEVWGMSEGFSDRTVDVNVSRLRKKIAQLSGMKTLQAVRGIGYSLGVRE